MVSAGGDEDVRRSPREVWAEWQEANASGDAERAGRMAAEMVTVAPDRYSAWFEAALLSKARGDWADAAERNAQAIPLFCDADARDFDGANPAAWNLGIAATVLGDWATARRAWTTYGLDGIQGGVEPIDADFGIVPIRVNPDRPSLPHQAPPELGTTEVVWCWRRSPAHAVISSVPLPESGHRFRDVLVHDGEPKGHRDLGGREVPVFDELVRLEDSGIATWQAQLRGVEPGDLDVLADLLGSQGLGIDDWSGMRVMCSDCSHGSPGPSHDHAPPTSDARLVGLAGAEAALRDHLNTWLAGRPHLSMEGPTFLW